MLMHLEDSTMKKDIDKGKHKKRERECGEMRKKEDNDSKQCQKQT